jgi:hypothetical protein
MAARLLASATGPLTTGSATVVARVIRPLDASTAARAVGPSSRGRGKSRWSFAESALKPKPSTVSVYFRRCWRDQGCPSKAISGRCTP